MTNRLTPLGRLSSRYPGLATIRLSPASPDAAPKSGSALVRFESAAQATVAKDALDGFLVDRDAPIQVRFAASA